MDKKRAYELLGITKEYATKEEVKHAYRQRCKQLHPDDNPSEQALKLYLMVQEAYAFVLEQNYYQNTEVKPYVFTEMPPQKHTGKVMGDWKTTSSGCDDVQYRKKMTEKLEKERKKKIKEEEERKRKITEAMRKARKLPSEREAEKWKKIEARREAERIASIIQQLIRLDVLE